MSSSVVSSSDDQHLRLPKVAAATGVIEIQIQIQIQIQIPKVVAATGVIITRVQKLRQNLHYTD